jgi:hypothetical protein
VPEAAPLCTLRKVVQKSVVCIRKVVQKNVVAAQKVERKNVDFIKSREYT